VVNVNLYFEKLIGNAYETRVRRSDGAVFLVGGVGRKFTMPHDLAHFLVESSLGLRHGFWGSIADGAVFGTMRHLYGRRAPHASKRSTQVLRANQPCLSEAEVLVAIAHQAFGSSGSDVLRRLRALLDEHAPAPATRPRRAITDANIQQLRKTWTHDLSDWRSLPVGGVLLREWPERHGARESDRQRGDEPAARSDVR